MHPLDAPVAFAVCAALGFWAVAKLVPKREPKNTPVSTRPTQEEASWDRGAHPHRFGHRSENEQGEQEP